MDRTFIIAEAGVNHNADLGLARGLIDAAAVAGADAVKFQTAIPELVVTRYAQKADYQKETSRADESQLEMIRKILFPLETHRELKAYCEERGVIFFSTAFDPVSLDFLETLGQPYHKIPSGEITNLPYLRQVGAYRRPTILSTGMSTLGEIEAALEVLEQSGTNRERITVLHCNTEYPTPMTDVNLRAMQTIREAFGVRVGYSDHTAGIEVSLAAVALGATMIEKHFTLDRQLPGPDHKASLEPDELNAMVSAIRNIELAMGNGIKRPSSSESRNKDIARRSLVAAHPIRAGDVFSAANLTAKRPGSGLSPMRWDEVMGRKAPRDFLPDEMIEL
ncbi:N-acetylneuraminate synthase [Sulfuritalea sp.]|uniref:N-acetylneuraminate synthase n=1 Tax=Sulfuritalea sp. TaxID=2480090 RepID=UPI001ACD2B3D|nr:N-acetylneuraminate synthase [Sulfuritalea sp.]MBN8473940.1 N-acetylneuraminate synthase [Sulfuritalea sp.]